MVASGQLASVIHQPWPQLVLLSRVPPQYTLPVLDIVSWGQSAPRNYPVHNSYLSPTVSVSPSCPVPYPTNQPVYRQTVSLKLLVLWEMVVYFWWTVFSDIYVARPAQDDDTGYFNTSCTRDIDNTFNTWRGEQAALAYQHVALLNETLPLFFNLSSFYQIAPSRVLTNFGPINTLSCDGTKAVFGNCRGQDGD